MPHRFWIIGALLVSALAAAPTRADETDDEGWTRLYDKEGIEGWRRSSDDSKLHEWRGQGYIDANFYRVVAVYMDSNRSDEWVADCLESVEVAKPDLDHQITYNMTDLPRPFWDRDFIWEEEYIYDIEARAVFDTMWSVAHDDYPEREGVVRGELLSSSFYARWDEPDRTWVEVRIHVDPGGKLPAWLINLVSRSWPFITFKDLRQQVYDAAGYDELEQALRQAHPMTPPEEPS